ncbi:MAG: hypothetical protein IJC48_00160 [Clostridia bacterium]|nr:hypothetical protein [Clostridia bacterium]
MNGGVLPEKVSTAPSPSRLMPRDGMLHKNDPQKKILPVSRPPLSPSQKGRRRVST